MTFIKNLKLALRARRRQCVPLGATTAAADPRGAGNGGADGGAGDLPCRAAMFRTGGHAGSGKQLRQLPSMVSFGEPWDDHTRWPYYAMRSGSMPCRGHAEPD